MPTIIAKFQKCGKQNCRCHTTTALHGPYLWLVSYIRASINGGKGKYSWKYLGKSSQAAYEKLRDINLEVAQNIPISIIQERLNKLTKEARKKALESSQKSFSRRLIKVKAN